MFSLSSVATVTTVVTVGMMVVMMITVHIALFSALEQTLCGAAFVACHSIEIGN